MPRESKLRESKVHVALNMPRLSYGVSPKALGYIYAPPAIGTLLIVSVMDWYWAAIPIALALTAHGVLMWAFKKDHRIFEILAKYSLMADEYHPEARENLPPGLERPHKVGRGLRI